jgi:N-formylglutamate deformylase
LAELGYRVAVNDPYKGVEIVRRHSLQIEVKRTPYMDAATLLPNAGYLRLETDLARLNAAVPRHLRGGLHGGSAP